MTAPTTERIGPPRVTVTGMEIPRFRGELITVDHAEYDDARALWNGTADRRPRLIARCTRAADVAAAVRFARDRNLEIAVPGEATTWPARGVRRRNRHRPLRDARRVGRPGRTHGVCSGRRLWGDVDHETDFGVENVASNPATARTTRRSAVTRSTSG